MELASCMFFSISEFYAMKKYALFVFWSFKFHEMSSDTFWIYLKLHAYKCNWGIKFEVILFNVEEFTLSAICLVTKQTHSTSLIPLLQESVWYHIIPNTSNELIGHWNLIVIKVVLEPTMTWENESQDLWQHHAGFKRVWALYKDPPSIVK